MKLNEFDHSKFWKRVCRFKAHRRGGKQTKVASSGHHYRDSRGKTLHEEAARLLRLNQPKISALANYRLEGFSVERLLRLLNALDRDIEIVIRRKRQTKRPGTIIVKAA
jgi:hypothetical protein